MLIWGKELEIGNKVIDEQHKGLIIRYNKLYSIISPDEKEKRRKMINESSMISMSNMIMNINEKDKDDDEKDERGIVGYILDDLFEYTVYHFNTEERLMELTKYKGQKGHEKLHKGFVKKVKGVCERFNEGENVGMEVLEFLNKWIQNHIMGIDSIFGEHLKKIKESRMIELNEMVYQSVIDPHALTKRERKLKLSKEFRYEKGKKKCLCCCSSCFISTFMVCVILVMTHLITLFLTYFIPLSFIYHFLIHLVVVLVGVIFVILVSSFLQLCSKVYAKGLKKEMLRIANLNLHSLSSNHNVFKKLNYSFGFSDFREVMEGFSKLIISLERIFKFVPLETVKEIVRNDYAVSLHLKQRRVTVMFTDLEKFTTLCEELSPDKIVSILKRFVIIHDDVVFKHEGFINSFLGDGLLILFNQPKFIVEHEKKSILAALEILSRIRKFNKNNSDLPDINIRIGINSGKALLGNVGSNFRTYYSVIGDCCNSAARLEMLNKVYQTNILVAHNTYKMVKDDYSSNIRFRWIDEVKMKGKRATTDIYEPRINYDEGFKRTAKLSFKLRKSFRQENNKAFTIILKKMSEIVKNDRPTLLLRHRIKDFNVTSSKHLEQTKESDHEVNKAERISGNSLFKTQIS